MSVSEDSGAFGALLKEAKGIAIFPSIIKIGWGMEGFMEDNLTLGGTASIAAGPLGRSLSADTGL